MKKVLLIHGPNLNLTGQREPGIYGSNTLASINAEVVQKCERLGMECAVFQSNSEGALIDRRSEERRVGKECRSRWSPYH